MPGLLSHRRRTPSISALITHLEEETPHENVPLSAWQKVAPHMRRLSLSRKTRKGHPTMAASASCPVPISTMAVPPSVPPRRASQSLPSTEDIIMVLYPSQRASDSPDLRHRGDFVQPESRRSTVNMQPSISLAHGIGANSYTDDLRLSRPATDGDRVAERGTEALRGPLDPPGEPWAQQIPPQPSPLSVASFTVHSNRRRCRTDSWEALIQPAVEAHERAIPPPLVLSGIPVANSVARATSLRREARARDLARAAVDVPPPYGVAEEPPVYHQ